MRDTVSEPAHRTVLAVDVEGFGRTDRNNLDRARLHEATYALLDAALRAAGIRQGQCTRSDLGDGVLVLIDPSVSKLWVVDRLVTELTTRLRSHNHRAAPAEVLRLRVVVHAGELVADGNGPFGEDLNLAFRLLSAEVVRASLRAVRSPLVLVVSDTLFQGVVKHGYGGIDPTCYQPVWVQAKETGARAWVHVPAQEGQLAELLARDGRAPCPYRGLAAFREADAGLFFGRRDTVEAIVEQVTRIPLVALVGPSGGGKSSVVFAGVIPRLRRCGGWAVADFRPALGSSPAAALAGALGPLLQPGRSETDLLLDVARLTQVIEQGQLADLLGRVLRRQGAKRLLLVADQFEELFAAAPADARRFTDLLLDALDACGSQPAVTLLCTLRADFLGPALEQARLATALRGRVLVVGQMTRAQLAEVVRRPPGDTATWEAGLVDRLLDDLGAEAGRLPLLEFTLTCLWDQLQHGRLTHEAYDRIGGVDGALIRYAEQTFARLCPEEQDAARQLFVQLVRPGEATDHTRRMATAAELGPSRWRLAQQLATTRLLVTGQDAHGNGIVELAHEALIANWGRLREWVEADRAFRLWQERLRDAHQVWQSTGRDGGGLLRGLPLSEAERWRAQRYDDLSADEHAFIRASRAHQQRTLRRLTALSITLVILLTGTVALGILSEQRRRQADAQSRYTLAEQLAREAAARQRSEPDVSLLLTLAAWRMSSNSPAAAARLFTDAVRYRAVKRLLVGHDTAVNALAITPDGTTLASAANDGVRLWETSTGQLRDQQLPDPGAATDVAYSADGELLLTTSDRGHIQVWDTRSLTSLAPLRPPAGHGVIKEIATSPAGSLLATATAPSADDPPSDGLVLWDLEQRAPYRTLLDDDSGQSVRGLEFSPDGRLLAAVHGGGGKAGGISVWDTASGERTQVMPPAGSDPTLFARSLSFSPDGRTLAAQMEGRIRTWQVDDPRRDPEDIAIPTALVTIDTDITFGPSNDTLLMTTLQGAMLVDIPRRAVHRTLALYTDTEFASSTPSPVNNVFHPAADVVAMTVGSSIYLWDPDELIAATPRAADSVLSGDGSRLIETTAEGIRVIDRSTDSVLRTFTHDREPLRLLATSANGTRVLAASGREYLTWNPSQPDRSRTVATSGQENPVAALSHDGDWAALATSPGTVDVVPLAEHAEATRIETAGSDIAELSFSADGRWLAIGDVRGQIFVADLDAQGSTKLLVDIGFSAGDLVFTPDGRQLVVGKGTTIVMVDHHRSVVTRQLPESLTASIVLSPDGSMLIAGGSNYDFELRDLRSNALLGEIVGASDIRFSADDKSVIIASPATETWPLDPVDQYQNLCRIVGREMTKEEQERYLHGRDYEPLCT